MALERAGSLAGFGGGADTVMEIYLGSWQLDKMQLINRRVNRFPGSCMFFDGGYITGN